MWRYIIQVEPRLTHTKKKEFNNIDIFKMADESDHFYEVT